MGLCFTLDLEIRAEFNLDTTWLIKHKLRNDEESLAVFNLSLNWTRFLVYICLKIVINYLAVQNLKNGFERTFSSDAPQSIKRQNKGPN